MATVATLNGPVGSGPSIIRRIRGLFRFEGFFALFLLAGAYKSSPSLAFVQSRIDLTILTAGISMIAGLAVLRGLPLNSIVLGPRVGSYLRLYGVYMIYALATHLLVDTNELGVIKAQKLLIFNTWCLLGAALCLRTREDAHRLVVVLLALCGAGVLNALLTSGSRHWQMFGAESYHQMGRAAMFGALISGTFVLHSPARSARIGFAILAGLCLTALVGSGTRHAMLGTAVGALTVILASLTGRRAISSAIRVPAGVMLLIGGFYVIRRVAFSDLDSTWAEGRILDSVERLRTGQVGDMPRVQMWKMAFDIWMDNPVFGAGFGSFWVDRGSSGSRQPHNIVLEHLCELGLVGLVLLTALLWMPIRDLLTRRELRDDPTTVIFAALLMATLAGSMTSGDISENRLLFPFSIIVIMSAYWPPERRAAPIRPPRRANIRNSRYRPVGPP